ncbi:glycoside hydrolase family 3 N-terminal domain-containing protein [Fibrella aquatilis]|uniref:beta-N-acetylhexosaminidase n=1 Tax=Fibrella aquatilis TaxID=2817059 RepID=A0A939G4T9_9BACT|nr:glycoside hydrolase family 3 N-terminal domain-containing protein [Fibrella aquatilis]MBO0930021.1 serine hydrolase [Fibrella aquatilis]
MTACRRTLAALLLLLTLAAPGFAQMGTAPTSKPIRSANALPPFLRNDVRASRWADSIMARMPLDEQIAQLIMVAGYSNRTAGYEDSLTTLVRTYKLGGVVFFQGGPIRQAKLNNRLQAASAVPLLVAMDAEWGIAMRLDSTVRFPYQMTLGGMPQTSEKLIYDMGTDLARQMRRLGMYVNFAPDADVNNNANNPVINFRSFGEDKYAVARKALAYMRGMQDNRLLTTLKHFPGHGDTGTDSHFDLPLINKSRAQLDSLELYPFRELIRAGAAGVMVAHLSVPALDTTRNRSSTLSPNIVTGLLKNELGFGGLVFSDAMNMKGLTKYFPSGLADRRGLEAGMDVLEFTENIPRAMTEICKAADERTLALSEIRDRCRKMLLAKYWVGLNNYRPVVLDNLVADLNRPESEVINRRLTEAALTVLANPNNNLPLQRLDTLRIASVSLEATAPTVFQNRLADYTSVTPFVLSSKSTDAEIKAVLDTLGQFNTVLVGIHLNNIRPAKYGMQARTAELVQKLVATGKAIVTVFGNPYVLDKLPDLEGAKALVMPYQLTDFTEDLSAQLIFGAIGASGRLPVTVNQTFRVGDGMTIQPIGRLKYTIPEEVGISSAYLAQQVDSVVNLGLNAKAFPGCVVQLAKDGKVIFRKAYGKHTYDTSLGGKAEITQLDDLYDFASVTKISTSTPALMRLVDAGKFNIDGTMGEYLPGYRKSNKDTIRWRDVLTHQAKLKAWIPFWQATKNPDGTFKKKTFVAERSNRYPIEVTDSLFLFKKYPSTIFELIKDSPLNAKKEYVYSDLSFYLYPQLVQRITGRDFEGYLKDSLYRPIGANTLTYNPRRFYPLSRIVPTEYDSLFRKTLIWGRVHDEGAAMLGGLSGHAGLFGTANDLMKLTQLYLQHGTYGDRQLIKPETITEFTRYQFPELGNRRGLGFEKAAYKYNGNAPRLASPSSYGHSGYTGTFTWIDPAVGLNYVFLCNRVYPTRNNNKISELGIRTGVADAFYKAIRRGATAIQ